MHEAIDEAYILGSLARALPVAEPIREFKEMLEASIEDGKERKKNDEPVDSMGL
jgi:hypothetical protein